MLGVQLLPALIELYEHLQTVVLHVCGWLSYVVVCCSVSFGLVWFCGRVDSRTSSIWVVTFSSLFHTSVSIFADGLIVGGHELLEGDILVGDEQLGKQTLTGEFPLALAPRPWPDATVFYEYGDRLGEYSTMSQITVNVRWQRLSAAVQLLHGKDLAC